MISIDVPKTGAPFRQDITLSGISYRFLYRYNSRSDRISLTILRDGEIVRAGLYLMENESLLANYNLPEFDHGVLQNVRLQPISTEPATVGTIGFNLPYELIYATNDEVAGVLQDGS